ncbi:hypothetical protein DFH06DRAFT_1393405 [Mycena polygramma]|nr:hypothetical protein DFH06DRAFT_1393405 [Mycena polygramma]
MVAWDKLSACRNTACPFGGSCGTFFPACGLDGLGSACSLGLKCICTCYGVQHVSTPHTPAANSQPAAASTESQIPTSTAPPAPPPSSTGNAAPPPFRSFHDAVNSRAERQQESATSRKERQQEDLKTHIWEYAFDPSKKPQASSWSKLADRPQKRKAKGDDAAPPAKRHASSTASSASKPAQKLVPFTLVLGENPARVHANKYCMPNQAKMQSLYRAGNIKPIEISPSTTPQELDVIVNSAFADHPDVVSGRNTLYKWCSLSKVSVSKGARPLLKAHREAGVASFQDFEWSAETHRQAKNFKRCVYLSLPRWASAIKLDIDSDTDVESDASSEEMNVDPSDLPDPEPCSEFPEPADLFPEEPAEDITCSIDDVVRLTLNITKAEADAPWWPSTVPEAYARVVAALPNVLRQLERIESSRETSSWTPRHLFDLAQDELFPALTSLVDFGDINTEEGRAQFNRRFCLGPFGLAPIIDFLRRLHALLRTWTPRLPHVELQGFISVLNSFSAPIFAAVLHFRSTTPRTQYDPTGFSTLREALHKYRHKFGEADAVDRLAVLDLLVTHDDVEAFVTALEADFGSATTASDMRPTALLLGPYGIDGFVERIIDPLLDTMPSTDPSFRPLMSFLANFCAELARKLTNFTKTQGKKKFGTTSASAGKDELDNDKGGSGYKTRSKSQSSHYTRSEEPLFFFPSESSSSSESVAATEEEESGTLSDSPSVREFEPTESDREQFTKPRRASQEARSSSEDRPASFGQREKFPYPEAHSQREQPFDTPRSPTPPPAPRFKSPPASSSRPETPPAASSSNRPKPRPAYRGRPAGSAPNPPPPPPPAPAAAAAPAAPVPIPGMAALLALPRAQVLAEALRRFPHPLPDRRRAWADIHAGNRDDQRRSWRQISKIYHPDKNTDMPEGWRNICDELTKGLNGIFSGR